MVGWRHAALSDAKFEKKRVNEKVEREREREREDEERKKEKKEKKRKEKKKTGRGAEVHLTTLFKDSNGASDSKKTIGEQHKIYPCTWAGVCGGVEEEEEEKKKTKSRCCDPRPPSIFCDLPLIGSATGSSSHQGFRLFSRTRLADNFFFPFGVKSKYPETDPSVVGCERACSHPESFLPLFFFFSFLFSIFIYMHVKELRRRGDRNEREHSSARSRGTARDPDGAGRFWLLGSLELGVDGLLRVYICLLNHVEIPGPRIRPLRVSRSTD